jgi:3-oxo-5-alpha-steroid 4-dehydrogenase 1
VIEWFLAPDNYYLLLKIGFGYAVFAIIGAPFVHAPYGRFANDKFGFSFSPKLGWFLMELPATLSFLFFYFQGDHRFETVPLIFLGIWIMHYGNKGFVFPMLMRVVKGQKSSFSYMVVMAGWLVTGLHGYYNAVFISHLSTHLNAQWLTDPRFIIGLAIYFTGFILNVHSDGIIRNLRRKAEVESGEKVYRIPKGGLFRYVTNPSYFTEILFFIGFAIATWSLGAVFVLVVTAANLIPRAFHSHRWYQEKFEDYPKERKVLIPFVL